MAELSVDIVANARGVDTQLRRTQRGVDGLEKEMMQASRAANALDVNMRKVGKSNRQTSQSFFQIGQAVSDFSVAGIRGAANNLEFLAFQMGASGPLILAITAATVAFIAFEDQIIDAVTGGSAALADLTEDVKGVSDSIIELSKATKISFSGSLEDLEDNASSVGQVVEKLEEQARNLRLELGKQQTQTTGGVTTFVSSSPQIREIQGDLEAVNNVLARQKGILESLNDTIEEEKLLQQVIADLEGTSLQKKEEEVKKEKEKLSILERIEKKNKDLQRDLDILQGIDQIRLGSIIEQNRRLDEQIKKLQEAARVAAFLSEIEILPSPGVAGPQQGEDLFPSLGDADAPIPVLSDLEQTLAKLKPLTIETIEINRELARVIDELGFSYENLTEEQMRIIELNMQLAESVRGGLSNAFSSFFSALGANENPFAALKASIGEFAIDVGKTMIAFGTSGIALKAFVTNPVGAIVAGGALVALGSALKSSVEKKTDSFTSGGNSTGQGLSPSFVDPRQGRTGRFQRDTSALGFTVY